MRGRERGARTGEPLRERCAALDRADRGLREAALPTESARRLRLALARERRPRDPRTLCEQGRRRTRRVEACERCRRYVKVIAPAAPTPSEMLLLADPATLNLDAVARERGFSRY